MTDSPTLRFPDFTSAWEKRPISEWFKISAGGDVPSQHSDIQNDKFKYPIYANSDKADGLYGYSAEYREEGGCVTVTGRGNLGIPKARHFPFTPIVRLLVLRPKQEADITFYENALLNVNFHVESTGVPQLTGPQISIYDLAAPCYAEQRRIADALSAVDNKIDLLTHKRNNLARFKAGLMQKIFSQEVRFTREDGSAYPDWEEKRLGDIATISKGQQLNRQHMTEDGAFSVINGGITPSGNHTESNRDGNVITISEGGNSCGYVDYQQAPFWCGGHCYSVEAKDTGSNRYLYHALKFGEPRIMEMRVGSGLPNIQKRDLSGYRVLLPSPAEQDQISHALDAVDSRISMVQRQASAMQTFKKGLLQQMFV